MPCVDWNNLLAKFFPLLDLIVIHLTDQGHDQDLVHLHILDVMPVVHMLKVTIEARRSLQELNTLLNLEVQKTPVT
jgi:hypothetical protein